MRLSKRHPYLVNIEFCAHVLVFGIKKSQFLRYKFLMNKITSKLIKLTIQMKNSLVSHAANNDIFQWQFQKHFLQCYFIS